MSRARRTSRRAIVLTPLLLLGLLSGVAFANSLLFNATAPHLDDVASARSAVEACQTELFADVETAAFNAQVGDYTVPAVTVSSDEKCSGFEATVTVLGVAGEVLTTVGGDPVVCGPVVLSAGDNELKCPTGVGVAGVGSLALLVDYVS